jgi:hypothetical protein
MTKVAVGVRVKDNASEAWVTISSVREDGTFLVDWGDGNIEEHWWHESDWLFDQPNDPLGPIRTETVTTRRLEPGVYGPLNLLSDRSADSFVRIALVRELHNSAELRELARVALEISEYLDAQ